ncbi:MAG: TIGR03619 family F420-dependent LLM class oxidoreductase [Acidimicrobiales bacterium]|nr:TIGR03619 family F420-dependent LLM class oxidoreductase [Acidimicrobiales bacterium]
MAPTLTIQPRNFAAEDPGSWDVLIDTACAADAAGVDRIILSDHVVMGENLDAYGDPKRGGSAGGKQPTGPDGHWLEPLTTLSFLAGQTESVRLGTNILIAALRRPVVLAKTASTLAVLSGGRLDLGVGVGWQEEEYVAAGLDFAGRGRQLDHTLEVCQALWAAPRVSYASDELTFDDIHMMPKPPGGSVPVWVSGTVNPRAMKRLARFGSGWIPWGPAVADPLGGIAAMREMVSGFDRDPTDIEVTAYLKTVADDDGVVDFTATMASAAPLVDAGVTDCKVTVPIPADREAATEYLSEAVAAFRAATT